MKNMIGIKLNTIWRLYQSLRPAWYAYIMYDYIKKRPIWAFLVSIGADDEIWTHTSIRSLPPQSSVSAIPPRLHILIAYLSYYIF